VSGDFRGCNNDYGSFTIIEISATSVNATFSQTCESTTAPPLVGFVRFNATTPTPVPSLPSSAQPITPPANSGTTSANADEFNGAAGSIQPVADFFGYFAQPLSLDAPPATPTAQHRAGTANAPAAKLSAKGGVPALH